MMSIYDQHQAAFSQVSAYVVMRGGERVATIAFKFPRDGAGRLYAYVHWLGCEMVRGWASGYGYDKRSASCSSAAKRMHAVKREVEDGPNGPYVVKTPLDLPDDCLSFKAALTPDDGRGWDRRLRDAGFEVIQAV